VGFHYTNSWLHWFETSLKLETDPSEIVNELIEACRKGGRIAIVGAYAGGWGERSLRRPSGQGAALQRRTTDVRAPLQATATTSTSVPSWKSACRWRRGRPRYDALHSFDEAALRGACAEQHICMPVA
jgi:hypothetical protein